MPADEYTEPTVIDKRYTDVLPESSGRQLLLWTSLPSMRLALSASLLSAMLLFPGTAGGMQPPTPQTGSVKSVAVQDASPGADSPGALSGRNPQLTDPLRLIVRPRLGDTLWLEVVQAVEIRAHAGSGDSRSDAGRSATGTASRPPTGERGYGPRRPPAIVQSTQMRLYAHSVVEARGQDVTILAAIADSMSVASASSGSAETGTPLSQPMPLPPDRLFTRIHVSPDGTMTVADPPPGAMALGTALAAMPGMFPEAPVSVGEKWKRDVPIPSLPIGGMRADGTLRVTFRLDSATENSRFAWVSMNGTLERSPPGQELPAGVRTITGGTIRGELILDRERAWITSAQTVINVESEAMKEPMSPGVPVSLSIQVTQKVRAR